MKFVSSFDHRKEVIGRKIYKKRLAACGCQKQRSTGKENNNKHWAQSSPSSRYKNQIKKDCPRKKVKVMISVSS